ncbi:hypothetical protein [Zavarzinella formosa]|uniref:hypothetical protein n=1 Tax=Zavarzinella formosa TaxID=360055 RepID=UPI00036028E1|nr:hypothetical protein [Zavarzinella formosa]
MDASLEQMKGSGHKHKQDRLWSQILGAINTLASIVEATSQDRSPDHQTANETLAGVYAKTETTWNKQCVSQEEIVAVSVKQMGSNSDKKGELWSHIINAINTLADMMGASKGRFTNHYYQAAKASMVAAIGDAYGEMSRETSQPNPTIDRLKETLNKIENDDIINDVIITNVIALKAWLMAESRGKRGFVDIIRPEPRPNPPEEYKEKYAEMLELSQRILAECESIEMEAASKIAPLKDELEQAAIRFEPYFDAKLREQFQNAMPKTSSERHAFCEWVMKEVIGLGCRLFEPRTQKAANLKYLDAKEQYRLIPIGATNGPSNQELTELLPFQITVGGKRKMNQEGQQR